MEYKIVNGTSKTVESVVNGLFEQGWKISGNLISLDDYGNVAQPMVKGDYRSKKK